MRTVLFQAFWEEEEEEAGPFVACLSYQVRCRTQNRPNGGACVVCTLCR